MLPVLLVSAGVLLYVFLGYPWLLWLIVRVRGPRPIARGTGEPPVSLVISAYNEAAVMRDKIQNALALDYPRDRLEIAVISDASTDATDDIVREFGDRGVRLFRQPERRGKTAGLNAVVPQLRGEIVVFSDANAIYERDAVRKLVRNFADPHVGCVTGEARYRQARHGAADVGETAYWNYELQIKRLETAVGSSVGGDGAIYAIRRALWATLPETAINDFLNPLQIVAAGWRSVYEPEAVCWEETAGGIVREYRRRVRIVSRSWRAIFQVPQVLNPFRVGIFALSVVSHKILRWFAGSIAVVAMASLAGLTARLSPAGQLDVLMLVPVALVIALIISPTRRLLALGGYFAVINAASAVGLFRGTFGLVSGTWAPPRAADVPRRAWGPAAHAWGRAAALGLAALLVGGGGWLLFASRPRTVTVAAFWISVGTLVYIYLGYPLVMFVWRTLGRRPTRDGTVTPSVCLFIAAHNEEAVIRQKLWNSLALDYPPDLLQIVVASDGSDDETAAITRSVADERVRLLEFAERRGKISAINRGMACVASEVVVFSDANTFLEPDALRRLVGRFADPEVGGVSGDVILVGERAALAAPEDLYYWYERWLQAAESDAGTMVGADGALYAVRRALFVAPPDDTILDDMAIPIAVVRAGRRVVFEPGARAFEQGSRSAREEFSRKSRVVAGAVQLVERSRATFPWRDVQFMFALVSHKALRWLSPWFAVVAFMSSAGLAQTAWGYVEITIAQGLFLGAGLAGCVPALRRLTPVAVAHYFLLVQAAALIGLARGILHRQPTAWRRFERAPVDGAPATPDRTATERISG